MVHWVGGLVDNIDRALDRETGPLLHGGAVYILFGMLDIPQQERHIRKSNSSIRADLGKLHLR